MVVELRKQAISRIHASADECNHAVADANPGVAEKRGNLFNELTNSLLLKQALQKIKRYCYVNRKDDEKRWKDTSSVKQVKLDKIFSMTVSSSSMRASTMSGKMYLSKLQRESGERFLATNYPDPSLLTSCSLQKSRR